MLTRKDRPDGFVVGRIARPVLARWAMARRALALWAMTLGVLAPASVQARPFEGLSRRDQVSLLYKPQFQFTRDGEPLVSVGLVIGAQSASFGGPKGARLLPAGEDGVELPVAPGERVRVRVGRVTPAKVLHWAAVRMAGSDAKRAAALLATWTERGLQPRHFDVGGVLGLEGRVLDNRVTVIGLQSFASRSAAKAAARKLSRAHKTKVDVYEELRTPPSGVLEVVGEGGGVRARVLDLLWIVAAEGDSVELDGRPYRGTLYATLDAQGKLAVANSVPAEQMLLGLVPAEIFPSAPMEALKAQAVTARGEVLAKIGTRHFGEPYRVCAKQHCQVYKGQGQEHPRATRAVEATRGKVLWGEKRLIDTVYSASCGGHTEHNELVWESRQDANLRGVPDGAASPGDLSDEAILRKFLSRTGGAHCARAKLGKGSRYRWTRRFSQAELRALVGRVKKVGAIARLEPTGRGVSGRVTGLRIVGSEDTVVIDREYPVRRALGGLFSGMFVVDAGAPGEDGAPSEFILRGGGWGHGVGMCQTGAMGMAHAGRSFKDILQHYYKGGKVRKLY